MEGDYIYLHKGRSETKDMGMKGRYRIQDARFRANDPKFRRGRHEKAESAFKRSLVYEVLSYAFTEPSTEFFNFIKNGEFFENLRSYMVAHPEGKRVDMSLLVNATVDARRFDIEMIGSLYQRLVSQKHSFLHECRYHNQFNAYNEMADIAGFYRAFGLGFEYERPDHVSLELEFMRVLTMKEARALMDGESENLSTCISAQKKFLESHLGRWVSLLSKIADGIAFYGHVCRFLKAFLDAECNYLSIKPEELNEDFLEDISEDVCSLSCAKEG